MEIFHHVNVHSSTKEFYNAVLQMGIECKILEIPGKETKLLSFNVSESDPLWETMFNLLKTHQGFDIYHGGDIFDTYFTEDEIRNAEWLRLVSTFEQGYPQPESNWPFKQLSLSNVCPYCALYTQTGSMRLKKEPRLGKNSFVTLIALNELFATQEVFSTFQSAGLKGFEAWEVILHRLKQPSEKVRQLYVPGIAGPGLLDTEKMRQVLCPVCGVSKYYSHLKGMMKLRRKALLPDVDFMRTYEWFGVGLVAFREIIVSNRVANLILDKGWQGIRLKVIELE